jgi:CSLREA domain-containing protein
MRRNRLAVRVLTVLMLPLAVFAAHAATITVTSTADTVTPSDGSVTLREAITAIDAGNDLGDPDITGQSPGTFGVNDTINFAVPGAGVHTITPASPLPFISKTVTINGYSQAGSSPNTNPFGQGLNTVLTVELAGTNGQLSTNGAGSNGTIIRGLVLANGVVFGIGTSGNTIEGSFMGTNASGTAAASGGGTVGVLAAGNNTQIGGTTPAARNLISGIGNAGISSSIFPVNATVIQGNLIGTNAAGTAAIPNGAGIFLGSGATFTNTIVGGSVPGAGNVISGNINGGMDVGGTNLVIQGNYVGTDATGNAALGNAPYGIVVEGSGAIIGGTSPGAGNVISGNGNFGLSVAFNTVVQGNRIGTNAAGTAGVGAQSEGIQINGTNNTIGGTAAGAANVIAFQSNAGAFTVAGIALSPGFSGNAWLTNSIHDNGGTGGIVVGGGANVDTQPPVLASATFASGNVTVTGTSLFGLTPNATYRIEFFSNVSCDAAGHGEGMTFLGAQDVTANGSGQIPSFGPFTFAVPAGQPIITMTATSPTNSSSAFSNCTPSVAATTTSVASSVNPSTAGQSVTFTATVSGGSSPTGTVQFFDGASALGSAVALSGATATLTTAALSAGTHSITASYGGNGSNSPSTSAPLSQQVNGVGPVATTTTVASSLNPSTFGQSVTFIATVSGSSPTGTVQFRDGGTNLGGSIALSAGTAQFATSALAVGSHSITAVYGGNASNLTSTSAALVQAVNAPGGGGPSVAAPIPAVSEWALLVLALALGAWGAVGVRRRKPG